MLVADEPQARLLTAAGEIFAEKGFRAATVREILRRANMQNLAAVNYYFGDKERLYEAALRHACDCRFTAKDMPAWQPDTPPGRMLRDFIRVMLARMVDERAQPWQMQLMMTEFTQPSPAGEAVIRDFIQPIEEMLWNILRRCVPDADERRIHLIGFSIVGQCLHHRIGRRVIGLLVGEEQQTYTVDLLANHIADFSLKALGLEG